jgi:segregation and condensation protein B
MDSENEQRSEIVDVPGGAQTAAPEVEPAAGSPPPAEQADGSPQVPVEPEVPILPPQEIRAVLETLIFASPQPVTSKEITQVMQGVPKSAWLEALDEIKADYARDGRGLQVVDVAGGYQITTRPEYNDWVRQLLDPKPSARLSIQALETLAVIAYKQPVTQPEVIELRGVKSGGVVKTLLEKRLIKIVGRKEVVGRPILYGTTKHFLLHFGLKDLTELPKIEEFAEVLGEEVDVAGLKKAIEAPRPVEVPLTEEEAGADAAAEASAEAGSEAEAEPAGEDEAKE